MFPLSPRRVGIRWLWCVAFGLCIESHAAAPGLAAPTLRSAPLASWTATASDAAPGTGEWLVRFAHLGATEQASQLRGEIQDGELSRLGDDQVMKLMDAMKPAAFVALIQGNIAGLTSYEFNMYRQERLGGVWQTSPDHILVRYQDQPRRIYLKWLPDGAHAGQEALYDETHDRDNLYGHPGGLFSFYSSHTGIDSSFARSQSRHNIRDSGFQFIEHAIEHDAESFREEGLSDAPSKIEFMHLRKLRVLALTWDAPSGPPAHYARRVRLFFDLKHLWPRGEAAWNENGNQLEMIYFEDVVPHIWSDETFNPKNPSYDF